MKLVVTFICGALFGAFVVINLWQPTLGQKKNAQNDIDIKVQRFKKDFDTRKLKKRRSAKKNPGDALDRDLDDMQDQMQKAFRDTGSIFKMMENSIQGAAIGAMGVKVGEIVEKITADSVILEMDISNIDNSSINIEVKDGTIFISGEARVEKIEESGGSKSSRIMVTSFSRNHPVPEGTRGSGLRIENKDENTLQMIFPKKK